MSVYNLSGNAAAVSLFYPMVMSCNVSTFSLKDISSLQFYFLEFYKKFDNRLKIPGESFE